MSSSAFHKIVNRETVLGFGVKPSEWDDEDQADLHEAMILAWKENPDWTNEQANEACKKQVERICFENFRRTYKTSLRHARDLWYTTEEAYEAYLEHGKKDFESTLNEEIEFSEFAKEFYDDLREMYNICSAGMMDSFQDMKKNGWTHTDFRRDLNKKKEEMKKRRR
jgi:hypothetical protein